MQISTHTYIKRTALFIFATISLQTFCNTPNSEIPQCRVPGMVGTCPAHICSIIERLKKENELIKKDANASLTSPVENVLLLQGQSGTGKTKLAKEIINNTDSILIEIYSHDLLTPYRDGGKRLVNQTIENAILEAKTHHKRIIIVVDRIDDMSCTQDSLSCNELRAAYQALMDQIETHKNNPGIFFILTATHTEKLFDDFKKKFNDHTISLHNPDSDNRKEFLHHYSKRYTKKELNEYCSNDCIEKLIRETKNFNAHNITTIYSNAIEYATFDREPIAEKHLLYALEEIKATLKRWNAPSKEEQERQDALAREKEHLWWARINALLKLFDIFK